MIDNGVEVKYRDKYIAANLVHKEGSIFVLNIKTSTRATNQAIIINLHVYNGGGGLN